MDALQVVGAGGIGCALAYALRAAGVPLSLVEADPARLAWGRQHGVRVDERPAFPTELVPFGDWTPPAGAMVLLCTKCYDNAAVRARLPGAALLVPVQNGFDRDLTNAGEGIASFISECLPGRTHTRLTRPGKLHLGYRRPLADIEPKHHTRIEQLFDALAAGIRAARLPIRVERVPDILPFKYTKLMYNAAISPLAAAAGLHNGELLSIPKARQLFFAQIQENYAILKGAGITLGKVGPFHPDTVQRILSRRIVARAFAWAFYPTLRRTYCSMFADLPAGRTEIDFYNRHLIDLAGDRPCPCNRKVYNLVKQMERERIAPDRGVLETL